MLHDLDKTLEAMLRHELPAALFSVNQLSITFARPDGQFPPAAVGLPAIDLFLYDLRENRDLRDNEWIVERVGGMVTKRQPPKRVDCAYLITAWPSDSAPNPTEDEHRLLGEVMRVLLRHATIPAALLQGSLIGQEPPLPTSSLQPSLLQSVADFWQALGGKPKAALSYSVTIGIDAGRSLELGPPVTEKVIRLQQGVTEEPA